MEQAAEPLFRTQTGVLKPISKSKARIAASSLIFGTKL
jgi:hypothetical protein